MAGYLFVRRNEAVIIQASNNELKVHPFEKPWKAFYNGNYFNVRAIVQRKDLDKKIDVLGKYLEQLTEHVPQGDKQSEAVLKNIMDLQNDHGKIYILTDRGILTYAQNGKDHYANGQAVMGWSFRENACITSNATEAAVMVRSVSSCPFDKDLIDWIKSMDKLNLFGETGVYIDDLYPRARNKVE